MSPWCSRMISTDFSNFAFKNNASTLGSTDVVEGVCSSLSGRWMYRYVRSLPSPSDWRSPVWLCQQPSLPSNPFFCSLPYQLVRQQDVHRCVWKIRVKSPEESLDAHFSKKCVRFLWVASAPHPPPPAHLSWVIFMTGTVRAQPCNSPPRRSKVVFL